MEVVFPSVNGMILYPPNPTCALCGCEYARKSNNHAWDILMAKERVAEFLELCVEHRITGPLVVDGVALQINDLHTLVDAL